MPAVASGGGAVVFAPACRCLLCAGLLMGLGRTAAAQNLAVVGDVAPAVVNIGDSVLFTFRAAPGQPALTMTAIEADLTAIGWGTTEPLTDDGQGGDVTAGDGVYSRRRSVAVAARGMHRIRLVNLGPQGGVADVELTVLPLPPPAPPTAEGTIVQTLPYG